MNNKFYSIQSRIQGSPPKPIRAGGNFILTKFFFNFGLGVGLERPEVTGGLCGAHKTVQAFTPVGFGGSRWDRGVVKPMDKPDSLEILNMFKNKTYF